MAKLNRSERSGWGLTHGNAHLHIRKQTHTHTHIYNNVSTSLQACRGVRGDQESYMDNMDKRERLWGEVDVCVDETAVCRCWCCCCMFIAAIKLWWKACAAGKLWHIVKKNVAPVKKMTFCIDNSQLDRAAGKLFTLRILQKLNLYVSYSMHQAISSI